MHEEVLTENQQKLLPLISRFSNGFGLVGGTAIALHLGHRQSIDFDIATLKEINHRQITDTIRQYFPITETLVDKPEELTIVVESVKLTFFQYPFPITFSDNFAEYIKLPDITTLAAMKAYALGRRSKWKDYVDLFFILKDHTFAEIVTLTNDIFKGEFNEKLFREQLSYFDDIDYSESIDYLSGYDTKNEVISEKLIEISLQK